MFAIFFKFIGWLTTEWNNILTVFEKKSQLKKQLKTENGCERKKF